MQSPPTQDHPMRTCTPLLRLTLLLLGCAGPFAALAADARADGQRAMRLVRGRAMEWNIDPQRIGMLGYSAGSNLVLNVASHFDASRADAADEVDRQSCRPDFAILLSTWPNSKTLA